MKKAFLMAVLGLGALTSFCHAHSFQDGLNDLYEWGQRDREMRRFADLIRQPCPVPSFCSDSGWQHFEVPTYNPPPLRGQIHPDGQGGYWWIVK